MTAKTSNQPNGIKMYDHLPPEEALRLAWINPGPHPRYHAEAKAMVSRYMPLLARAMERLTNPERKNK